MSATRPAIELSIGIRDQVVDVGHPAGDRVVDRDHAVEGQAIAHGGEGVLEGATGQGLHARVDAAAGHIGIGAGKTLEGDGVGRVRGIGHGSDKAFSRAAAHAARLTR
jgi:hypothetical protein